MLVQHEFETTIGDEIIPEDLLNATWKVVETYVDIDENTIIFTHRLEIHMVDAI